MSSAGERFDGFSTTAEQRWLSGEGPEPATAADRLPPRAGLLVPHAGAGHWWIEDLRTVRLWVDAEGRVQFRGRDGSTRCLVEHGRVHGCWWVVGAAAVAAVGLPTAAAGWLVLLGTSGPALALRLSDWESPLLDPDDPQTVRAAGAEALARALGADLEAVADHADAQRLIGVVPPEAVLTLDRPLPRRVAALFLGTPLAVLVAYWVMLATLPAGAATAICLSVLAVTSLAYDLTPLLWRRRRTRSLPRRAQHWWPAEPRTGRRAGAGLGIVDGPAGPELVLADGYGFEAWFPGPASGGAASLVLCDDDSGQPWSLVLHDRDQRVLAPLAVRDWAARPASEQSLATAAKQLGLVLSRATREPVPLPHGRSLSRRTSSNLDLLSNVAETFIAGVMTPLFWVSAAVAWVDESVADAWLMVGGALLVLRLAMRWRRVL